MPTHGKLIMLTEKNKKKNHKDRKEKNSTKMLKTTFRG